MSRIAEKLTVTELVADRLTSYCIERARGYVLGNDGGTASERGPDLIYFDEPRRVDNLIPNWTDVVPKLVVEVQSPTDQMTQTTRRVIQYLKHGVSEVWLVDPELQNVAVCRPDQFPQVLENSDDLTGGEGLPDFRCKVSDLFRMPGEGTATGSPAS